VPISHGHMTAVTGAGVAVGEGGNKFSKVRYIVTLYSEHTRALIF
jgi:hypothetical protein